MICTAQRSTLVFLPFSKYEALRRVLHGLPIPPAIQTSSVMLTTAAPIKPVKDHDIQSEQQEALAAAVARADAIAQQLLDEEEAAAAQAVARSAAKQGKKGKKRCAKKDSQQRQKANDQQLLQALVRPSAALPTPQA
ncbi:TPA: hypothetical protein ACH3X3_003093 [Trebouxia sp. C0006]